jgi:hypothetical protein
MRRDIMAASIVKNRSKLTPEPTKRTYPPIDPEWKDLAEDWF